MSAATSRNLSDGNGIPRQAPSPDFVCELREINWPADGLFMAVSVSVSVSMSVSVSVSVSMCGTCRKICTTRTQNGVLQRARRSISKARLLWCGHVGVPPCACVLVLCSPAFACVLFSRDACISDAHVTCFLVTCDVLLLTCDVLLLTCDVLLADV